MHPFEIREQEDGQGLVEYAFILLLVAMVALVALGLLGMAVFDFFDAVPDMFTP